MLESNLSAISSCEARVWGIPGPFFLCFIRNRIKLPGVTGGAPFLLMEESEKSDAGTRRIICILAENWQN